MKRIDIYINCKNCQKPFKVTPSLLRLERRCCSRVCGIKYNWSRDSFRAKMKLRKANPENINRLIAFSRTVTGRENNSNRQKGKIPWNKGKKMLQLSGENHYLWIKDRTKLAKQDSRNDSSYKEWRKQVWLRDNFKCKIANPDCNGKIEAHHILGWSSHLELRYQLNNGITLCHAHHPRKRAEEKRLSPYFQELVSVSKD